MAKNKIDAGELTDAPNEHYKKFFSKFSEIETLPVTSWKTNHILAYFCKKYKSTYSTDYQFKFNSPSPSKCFEVFQVKKLASMLSSDPVILKQYIDWVYEYKVGQAKRKLTSISFMTHEGVVNYFKVNFLLANKKITTINRSSTLPDDLKEVFSSFGFTVNTYGDISFMIQMSPLPDNIKSAFDKAVEFGLDLEVLKEVV